MRRYALGNLLSCAGMYKKKGKRFQE